MKRKLVLIIGLLFTIGNVLAFADDHDSKNILNAFVVSSNQSVENLRELSDKADFVIESVEINDDLHLKAFIDDDNSISTIEF